MCYLYYTQWLGQNTKYLGSASETVVAVSTATADKNGLSKGDVSLIFSEGLAIAIHASANGAIKACNAVSKRDPSAGKSLKFAFIPLYIVKTNFR